MKSSRRVTDAFVFGEHPAKSVLMSIFPAHEPIVILDIGACDGLSTVQYSRWWPNSTHKCIEMVRRNCDEMRANFEAYGIIDRTEIACTALGANRGNVEYWHSYGQSPKITDWDTGKFSSSILKPGKHIEAHPWCRFRKAKVRCVRLDDLGFTGASFAHIDVQGAEIDVLSGGETTLQSIQTIFCEVSNIQLYEGQPLKSDVVAWLGAHGFGDVIDYCGSAMSGDILAIRTAK